MRLLVDSDAFCKLAASHLLLDAVALFHAELGECGRLPALPHMLRRGRLRQAYGDNTCERLIPLADSIPPIGDPPISWLEELAGIPDIDPGEAILFATAAEQRTPVITGDIRSLVALKRLPNFCESLNGRVAVLEAVLLGLCARLGSATVRARIHSGPQPDTVMQICFSPGTEDPDSALRSYLHLRTSELTPLALWGTQEDDV